MSASPPGETAENELYVDCSAGEACGKGTPDDIGAPAFLRIDVAQKAVIGLKRTSAIHFTEKSDNQLLLQGTEMATRGRSR